MRITTTDTVLHGLSISPDLDTITYTLAEAIDPERGWGLVDETWQAMEQVRQRRDAEYSRGVNANAEILAKLTSALNAAHFLLLSYPKLI